ncbi:MAG: hypothetical protein ABUS47_14555, partial [Steroidobacter sp.]
PFVILADSARTGDWGQRLLSTPVYLQTLRILEEAELSASLVRFPMNSFADRVESNYCPKNDS